MESPIPPHHQQPHRQPHQVNLDLVRDFWKWFNDNQNNFGNKFENKELLEDLDEWIRKLGPFAWEVGPGISKANLLVVSPGNIFELLALTKEVVSYASQLRDWEIYYAKPPKNWDFEYYFQDTGSERLLINASNWRYILFQYEDGQFEILVEAGNISGLKDDEKLAAAEIVLEGILGEEIMIVSVCGVEVVATLEAKYASKAINGQKLKDHLVRFFAQN